MTNPTATGIHPSRFGPMVLVAQRELVTRLRSRVYRIATLALLVIIVGLPLGSKLISGSVSDATIGLVPQTASVAQGLVATGTAVGERITIARVPDQATGEQQVRAGKLDALLIDNGRLTAIVKKNINNNLAHVLNTLAQQRALSDQIARLGGHTAQVLAAAASATIAVDPLERPYPYRTQQLVLGIATGVLIYLSLLINGQLVAQGVVEEKSSRVVELLVSTIQPWQLMAGKVLGIGTVGLIQTLIIGLGGLIAGLATDVLTISVSMAAGVIAWLVIWYLLGFFMYAVVFAGLGALVSRQEEVAGVTAPALVLIIAGYLLGVTTLPVDPGSALVATLSVIPMFAPTLMPMRLAIGGVPGWEAVLAIVLVAALIPALLWVVARIYRNAVLRTGARVSLVSALRPA